MANVINLKKAKRKRSTYELTGEKYITDGVWITVIICEGSKKHCENMLEDWFTGEHRNVQIHRYLGEDEEDEEDDTLSPEKTLEKIHGIMKSLKND